MLPAAKALLVTVLLGGGTVGTYALVGGSFGTGGNGSGNAETAQTSTTEVAEPGAALAVPVEGDTRVGGVNDTVVDGVQSDAIVSDDGQTQPRVEDATLSSSESHDDPREEETLEVEAKDGDSVDASSSTKAEPEVKGAGKETVENQQKESKEEVSPSESKQEGTESETPGVNGGETGETKTSLDIGSNGSETDSRDKAASEAQVGQQSVEATRGKSVQENVSSPNNQVSGKSSKPNAGQDGQTTSPAAQDKGGAGSVNQAALTVTADPNTNAGGSSPAGQVQA